MGVSGCKWASVSSPRVHRCALAALFLQLSRHRPLTPRMRLSPPACASRLSAGFSIDVGIAWANAPLVLGMTAGLITLKSLIVALVCTLARLKLGTAIRSGLLLAQGGEFAFVIFGLAQTHGILLPKQACACACGMWHVHVHVHV
mgnify:CR=1 FL=1